MPIAWFKTVAEVQRRAQKRLRKSVYGGLVAGMEKGPTLAENLMRRARFAPHAVGLSETRDLSTTVMGRPISMRAPGASFSTTANSASTCCVLQAVPGQQV
jgi:isopentenyl diphosphate isomerase/L-lactate dehydrogenase-like FMN-dependent dehydrogenase